VRARSARGAIVASTCDVNAERASPADRFLDAAASGPQAGVGRELARARERRGLSLHDVSLRTRIAVPLLEQIERDEFSMVPEGIYARGMLRAIAREVGCDAESVVRRFVQQHPIDPPAFGGPPPVLRNGNRDAIAGQVHAAEIDSLDRPRQFLRTVRHRLLARSVPAGSRLSCR
jgi:transcriptional regulator with XRE-family HTH domain